MKRQATFDGITWYDITNTRTEEVVRRKKPTIILTKYYFGEQHAPAYEFEIKEFREIEE